MSAAVVEYVDDRPDLPLSPPPTDVEEFRARIEAKRARAHLFRRHQEEAIASQSAGAQAARRREAERQKQPRTPAALRPARPVADPVRECAGVCGRMTRPYSSPESEYPGTIARHGRGMCARCYKADGKPFTAQRPVVAPCPDCGRLTRPSSRLRSEFPDTVVRHGAAGRCATCHERVQYEAEHGAPRPRAASGDVIRPCAGCGQLTRPTSQPKWRHPDTKLRMDSRLCVTCYRHERGVTTAPEAKPLVRPCTACSRPTRSARQTVEEHPGTVVRSARGMCSACYVNARKAEQS